MLEGRGKRKIALQRQRVGKGLVRNLLRTDGLRKS